MLSHAVSGTESYPPEHTLPTSQTGSYQTVVVVENQTTLTAAKSLIDDGYSTVLLNFASATKPGGGFLSGARAQEEYLARSSGLYACLRDNPMYDFHLRRHDALYTNYVIYSPAVPVFRADDHQLLESPYLVGMMTSPAVYYLHLPTERQHTAAPAMRERISKVLSVGLAHGHDAIVLGAWGCGAFGNDGNVIAPLFHDALSQDFRGAYKKVIFAILDWSPEEKFIGSFRRAFSAW